ncbi:MAG TPA: tetratricopeptide repeat protein, partial [Burkholderiales bacterium]|nr:tetratricopeptide repeat protein [Burkholderiales bacterium]
MTLSQHKPSTRFLALLLCVALVAGCATSPAFTEGQRMVESGNVEAGLARIEETLKNDPDNLEIRNYYERHKAVAVQRYLSAGDAALSRGSLEQAEASYRQAQRLAPDSVRAREGIVAVEKERNVAARVAEAQALFQAGDLDAAYAKAKEVLAESPKQREAKALARAVEEKRHRADAASPKLNAALKKSITLEFRDAPLRQVFELISKNTGLNFVFDR